MAKLPSLWILALVALSFIVPCFAWRAPDDTHNFLFSDLDHPASSRPRIAKRDSSTRDVFVEFQVNLTYYSRVLNTISSTSDLDFSKLIVNAFVDILGNDGINGDLKIGLAMLQDYGVSFLFDNFGHTNSTILPLTRFVGSNLVKSVQAGSIKIDDKTIFDPETGKGLLNDIWSSNNKYSFKTHNSVDVVMDVLKKIGAPVSGIQQLYDTFKKQVAATNIDLEISECLLVGHEKSDGGSGSTKAFKVSGGGAPQAVDSAPAQDISASKPGGTQDLKSTGDIKSYFASESRNPFLVYADEASDLSTDPFLPAGEDTFGSDNPNGRSVAIKGPTDLALIRSKGVFSTITSVAKTAADVIGKIDAALAPAFIILDIVQGQWKAAAFGAAAAVGGLLAGFLVSGPIGILLGAAVSLFFSILPGLFGGGSPHTDNPAQIIQNAFFGKPDHTGNEDCNKQRKQAGLDQNCTALYGAATISKSLKINYFDAIILLINFNEGFPMSIIDLAAIFPVKDYTQPGWQNDKLAYIDCGETKGISVRQIGAYQGNGPILPSNQVDLSPAAAYKCGSAKFIVNRTLITIPGLGATADAIYSRIIPAPGGDCKLLSDASDSVKIPFVDLTITGRPVGIACNVTVDNAVVVDPNQSFDSTGSPSGQGSTTEGDGTQFIWNSATNASIAISSNSTISNPTTNSSIEYSPTSAEGAYRPVPPPQDFQLYNDTNAVCFSAPNQYLCLPSGTYQTSNGGFGYNTPETTAVSIPPGASLSMFWWQKGGSTGQGAHAADFPTRHQAAYTSSIAGGSNDAKGLQQTLKQLAASQTKLFTIDYPNSPPGACVFDGTNFTGNVQCFGLGGHNLPEYLPPKAQSISLVGEVEVYIFSGEYGDTTEQDLHDSVPYLSDVKDGSEETFAGRLKALWITLPPNPFESTNDVNCTTSPQNCTGLSTKSSSTTLSPMATPTLPSSLPINSINSNTSTNSANLPSASNGLRGGSSPYNSTSNNSSSNATADSYLDFFEPYNDQDAQALLAAVQGVCPYNASDTQNVTTASLDSDDGSADADSADDSTSTTAKRLKWRRNMAVPLQPGLGQGRSSNLW